MRMARGLIFPLHNALLMLSSCAIHSLTPQCLLLMIQCLGLRLTHSLVTCTPQSNYSTQPAPPSTHTAVIGITQHTAVSQQHLARMQHSATPSTHAHAALGNTCKMYVSLLSLNGMYDARSVRDLMHFPRAVSDELIAMVSCISDPDTLDLNNRSEPAKSTMYNLEELCTQAHRGKLAVMWASEALHSHAHRAKLAVM